MRNKIACGFVALVLASGLYYVVNKQEAQKPPLCDEYKQLVPVNIVGGTYQGASGVIIAVMFNKVNGSCLYNVRGQHGVEMPFVDWFDSFDLAR